MPLTTLLDKPWEPTPPKPEWSEIFGSWKKRQIGIIFSPITLPILLLAAVISIPWGLIANLARRRSEGRFAEQMKAAGRSMPWGEFQRLLENGDGTAIQETLSLKGPVRLWWTPEDVPATSPHKWHRDHDYAFPEPEFEPFDKWCYERFTNADSGTARFVRTPQGQEKWVRERLPGIRLVWVFSSRKRWEQQTLNN